MKKVLKIIICLTLVILLCVTSAPLGGFVGLSLEAKAVNYKVGDIIEFGTYPQSKVTDENLISELNDLAPEWKDWIDYGYYSGDSNSNFGSMEQGDWMRYIDITYKGNTYRGVKFTKYRPYSTYHPNDYTLAWQDDNGYSANKTYWFAFERLRWKVIDPAEGLVVAETVIDSQPFNNLAYWNKYGDNEFYIDWDFTKYTSDYASSSIRKWLNDDFYNTAFSQSQKEKILKTTLDNSTVDEKYNSEATNDNVFLLSYKDIDNEAYGFIKAEDKMAKGSDYAKAQGLYVSVNGYSNWITRSAGLCSYYSWGIDCYGRTDNTFWTYGTEIGIRPAIRIKDISDIGNLMLNCNSLTVTNNVNPVIYVAEYPFGVTKDDIVWSSSNENVAYITDEGTVKPILYGKTRITATTKDGMYEAFCDLTVESSFVLVSENDSVSSIAKGKTSEYRIGFFDYEGTVLPVDDVNVGVSDESILKITEKKIEDNQIIIKVKGLKSGVASINVGYDSPETQAFSQFAVSVFPEPVTYRADGVPVENKKYNLNFVRSDMYVEDFEYTFDEINGFYNASMEIYNKSGAIGIVASYYQDGTLYDVAQVKRHVPLPTKFLDFIFVLGKATVDLMAGDMFNYRYSVESTKTNVNIKVPENGYITVSNDIAQCKPSFICNLVSVAVETTFLAVSSLSDKLDKSDEVAKKISKKLWDNLLKDAKADIVDNIVNELTQNAFTVAYTNSVVDAGEYSLDVVDKLFAEIDVEFFDLFNDVVYDVVGETIKGSVSKATLKTLIKNNLVSSAANAYINYGKIIFKSGEYINLLNQLLGTFVYNYNDGLTTINFGVCGEDGFLCKDNIKVKTDEEVVKELTLQHYVIKPALGQTNVYTDLDIQESDIVEIHEISVYKDGKPYKIKQATVKIDLPSSTWANKKIEVFRLEEDGTYTSIPVNIFDGSKNTLIFNTEHFSNYIIVGRAEEVHVHNYVTVVKNPTCVENGLITYTCDCSFTYTETVVAKGHIFNDGESKCINCDYDNSDNCLCNCHKNGFVGFIWRILRIFYKLFGLNKICNCGIMHY